MASPAGAQRALSTAPISIEDYGRDFDRLEKDWDALLQERPDGHVFSTPLWCRVWWRHLGGGEAHLLRLHRGGQPIGIVPLMRIGSRAMLLGDKEVCDYLDFISVPGQEAASVRTVVDFARKNGWELDLHPLPAGSPVLAALDQLGGERSYTVEREVLDVSYLLELPSSWDDYLSALPVKDRHELRRKMRRLSRVGRAALVEDTNVEEFLHLFRQQAAKSAFLSPPREAFFREMMQRLMDAGWLRLYFLELDGKRVATAVCFDYRGVFSLYNSGFDPAYSDLSVGLICKAWTIQEAIRMGRKRFDFLRGAENYKAHLGGRPVEVYRCIVRPAGGEPLDKGDDVPGSSGGAV